MIRFIQGWFHPTYQSHPQQRNSIVTDAILGIALSAFALISADSFDRNAPGLALLLRCVPVGVTLICLFKYYALNKSNHQQTHSPTASYPIPPYSNQTSFGSDYAYPSFESTPLYSTSSYASTYPSSSQTYTTYPQSGYQILPNNYPVGNQTGFVPGRPQNNRKEKEFPTVNRSQSKSRSNDTMYSVKEDRPSSSKANSSKRTSSFIFPVAEKRT